jgi:hypothetical protein
MCPALARPAGMREVHLIMAASAMEFSSGQRNLDLPPRRRR